MSSIIHTSEPDKGAVCLAHIFSTKVFSPHLVLSSVQSVAPFFISRLVHASTQRDTVALLPKDSGFLVSFHTPLLLPEVCMFTI